MRDRAGMCWAGARQFLLAETASEEGVLARARLAIAVAHKMASALAGVSHPYSQLMANLFCWVEDGEITWVAHEFLTAENHAYRRSEFLTLARTHGLEVRGRCRL